MDNASKALIIAGAILISVMLVSLGVMLYNTAAGTAESSLGSISAMGISSYNAQFETSFGSNKTRAQVATLISKVISNNGNPDNPKIGINSVTEISQSGADNDLSDLKAKYEQYKNVNRFTITGEYADDGTLNNIKISAPTTT